MERVIHIKTKEGITTAVVMNVQTMDVTKLNVQVIVCTSNMLSTFRVRSTCKYNYKYDYVVFSQEPYFD